MTLRPFKHFVAIDWSGAAGERHKGIALALADAAGGPPVLVDPGRGWSREEVLALLRDGLPRDTLAGLDLGISLPFADCGAYFPGLADGPEDARALWKLVDAVCIGDPHLGGRELRRSSRVRPLLPPPRRTRGRAFSLRRSRPRSRAFPRDRACAGDAGM